MRISLKVKKRKSPSTFGTLDPNSESWETSYVRDNGAVKFEAIRKATAEDFLGSYTFDLLNVEERLTELALSFSKVDELKTLLKERIK